MHISPEMEDLLSVGYNLATQTSFFGLFDTVLDASMRFTNADGGTLYITDEETGSLVHLSDINRTLDKKGSRSSSQADMIPADDSERNLFTNASITKKLINISDIYNTRKYDIQAIKERDEKNHYRTSSVMMVPIMDTNQKVLGVMMLYNCKDDEGNVVSFDKNCERTVVSIASQMANNLTNKILIQDQQELLDSFVECMITAIDAKTPYNANHTNHVTGYCMMVGEYINVLHTRGVTEVYLNENDMEQLTMAAMLHDIGKIITPREVLNKSTRLGAGYDHLHNKLEKIVLMKKIDMLEGRLDNAQWAMDDLRLTNFLMDLERMNVCDYLTDEDIARVDFMSTQVYEPENGDPIPYLSPQEKEWLHIRKGTLTDEEKEEVHLHVTFTDRILEKIRFTDKYNKVRTIAANHHEYLDGSGYPAHKTGRDLDLLTRILTVCDIFDSLMADDRPYKKALTLDTAMSILESMGEEGKLDMMIVRCLKDCVLKGKKPETGASL